VNFLDERLPMRFWDKVIPEPNSGCWIWTAASCPKGYGRISIDRSPRMVHRVAYTALVGAIPDGLHLDHLCRTPSCCNPVHLEPVTNAVNTARGLAGINNLTKTHCPSGHPYSTENTRMIHNALGRASRICKRCRRWTVANSLVRRAGEIHGTHWPE